jgi:hypothetical protein
VAQLVDKIDDIEPRIDPEDLNQLAGDDKAFYIELCTKLKPTNVLFNSAMLSLLSTHGSMKGFIENTRKGLIGRWEAIKQDASAMPERLRIRDVLNVLEDAEHLTSAHVHVCLLACNVYTLDNGDKIHKKSLIRKYSYARDHHTEAKTALLVLASKQLDRWALETNYVGDKTGIIRAFLMKGLDDLKKEMQQLSSTLHLQPISNAAVQPHDTSLIDRSSKVRKMCCDLRHVTAKLLTAFRNHKHEVRDEEFSLQVQADELVDIPTVQ